jgi:hypothetical protein
MHFAAERSLIIGRMDIWEAQERGAVLVLEREITKTPVDRGAIERALHLFAIGKNKNPSVPVPPLNVFDDATLVGFVNALLSGNTVGA